MRTLVGLHVSPWSERARWALDHHGIPFANEEYVPMLGEPVLRLRARRARGKITVPILFDGDTILGDSLAIARHADTIGTGTPLFPEGLDDEIDGWNEVFERAAAEARARVVARMLESPAAQAESLEILPRPLRAPLRAMAEMGVRYLARKHRDVTPPPGELVAAFDALRAALARNGGTVLAKPSFADLAMAALLQGVVPVDDRYLPLGPATREVWTNEELAAKYEDLVEWRDAIYARRRKPKGA